MAALACAALVVAACVVTKPIRVEPVDPRRGPAAAPVQLESPVKAHLLDGSTVVFEKGARVGSDSVVGAGVRYDLAGHRIELIDGVALARVGAMETFPSNRDVARTVTYTTVVALGGVVGTVALLKALFGSCPTIYADSAGTTILEAEAFSYSIAPLFEARDVDRLVALPDSNGDLVLEIRNEALETHSINHLELLDIEHDPVERVVPDERDLPVAVADFGAPIEVVDRAGRDLGSTLAAADGVVFASADAVRDGVTIGDFEDWIDVVAELPAGADSVAIVLRLRNSLLNTILFYDVMLGSQGAGALDWIGRDLARVGDAAVLGRWYHARMGMRLRTDGLEKRLGDAGPIAWKDVAIVLPAPAAGPFRTRLSFAADQWRIDRLEVATSVRRPTARVVPLSEVRDAAGGTDPAALQALWVADDAYVVTGPGTSFSARFDVTPVRTGGARTLLLASQGYYTEWIRGDWLRQRPAGAFRPTDEALLSAMHRWRAVQSDYEERFYAARVPVR